MVFSDDVCESALNLSREHLPLDRKRHRTKYVIELLGDYYHSEAVIGVPADRHEREIVAAYASAGIECLVLWEHEVLQGWEQNRERIESWVYNAMTGSVRNTKVGE
jgi:hypothetical protein